MGALMELWRHPRKVYLRKVAFQVHLWAGLILGLYMAVMSATGVVLLFADELEEALYPELYRATSRAGASASVSAFKNSAAAAYPDRVVTALYAPSHTRETVIVYLKKGDEVLYAYLDPVTARVLAHSTPSSSIVRWVRELHFNLFSGRTGRAVNGIGGLALFLLGMTGVIVWWPGIAHWRGRISFRFTRNWKRLSWNLHSAGGIWSVAALVMWALTGFYFGYPAFVNGIIHRLSPLSQVEPPISSCVGHGTSVDVQSLVADATRRSPGAHFYGVQMPANSRAAYVVFMTRLPDGEKRHSDYHYFDRYSGAYLGMWQRGRSASFGDAVIAATVPLHFGSFGGTPVKVIWAVLGVMPLVLFVTGVVMWSSRKPYFRRHVRNRESGDAGLLMDCEVGNPRPN